jgi:CRISPR-associated endonuclease/helicase Cas3
MSERLTVSDFSSFFRAVFGFEPFPWQKRLATEVCAEGRFPDVIDLPTGSGKTACIAISLFHLAYSLDNDVQRRAPLRIAWVVDRRLIVDEAYDQARVIAEKLQRVSTARGAIDSDPVLVRIAELFSQMAGPGEPPLVVRRLRGGIPREGDWLRTPTQPAVISSTVDQIGSRLLFRGYGVGPSMRPIHAGLFGEDARIVLDEVHLSEPFRQTLERIASCKRLAHAPWQFTQLSATPRSSNSTDTFQLNADDESHPVLSRRLTTSKPANLIRLGKLPFGSPDHAERFAKEAIAAASLGDARGGKNVLVVVNRVDLARTIFQRIERHLESDGRVAKATLLIGRARDIEKDLIRDEIVARCKSNPLSEPRRSAVEPYIVVSTQSIEAGADLDFDVLITQIAPLDALRQRFGRLNRMGRPITVIAAILAIDSEITPSAEPDPIYGTASRATWAWLEAQSNAKQIVDFSSSHMRPSPEERKTLSTPSYDAPLLMPKHLASLARTSPAPASSPDVALYLHGAPNASADVNVIWRADLPVAAEQVATILGLLPPRTGEMISLPLGAVRRWLRGEGATATSDVERDAGDTERADETASKVAAWRWRGPDNDVEQITDGRIRPGDTLVVSCDAGGCDRFGWNPESARVVDLAAEAARPYEAQRFAFRLHRALFRQEHARMHVAEEFVETPVRRAGTEWESEWKPISSLINAYKGERPRVLIKALLDLDASEELQLPDSWKRTLERLAATGGPIALKWAYSRDGDLESAHDGVIMYAKDGLREVTSTINQTEMTAESATESDEIGSIGVRGSSETLIDHSRDVRDRARAFAERLGLAAGVASDVTLAAYLHDIGKADPRFQRYLAGDPWYLGPVLAKSGRERTLREDSVVRRASGLPHRWRHEALSVRIAREHPDFTSANDPALVLWLIGTHHGFGRPHFPHEEPRDDETHMYRGLPEFESTSIEIGPSPGPQRTDFMLTLTLGDRRSTVDWHVMFAELEGRYGVWGLARLEAIVRLADHRASEAIGRRNEVVTA